MTATPSAPRVIIPSEPVLQGVRFCSCGKGKVSPFKAHTLADIETITVLPMGAMFHLKCGAILEAKNNGN